MNQITFPSSFMCYRPTSIQEASAIVAIFNLAGIPVSQIHHTDDTILVWNTINLQTRDENDSIIEQCDEIEDMASFLGEFGIGDKPEYREEEFTLGGIEFLINKVDRTVSAGCETLSFDDVDEFISRYNAFKNS